MSSYFFDSSALLKRYFEEEGTDKVDELFNNKDNIIIVSALAISEVVSAFTRKKTEKKLSENTYKLLIGKFFEELLSRATLVSIDDLLIEKSVTLIIDEGLRTLDSLQLAAFLKIKEIQNDITFVSADEQLTEIAKKLKLSVLDLSK